MRLIDADKLIEHLGKYKFGAISNEHEREYTREVIMCFVNGMPTAYSVEKVLAELEEELELAEKEEKRCLIEHSQRYERAEQYALGISNALIIVRNGGKE